MDLTALRTKLPYVVAHPTNPDEPQSERTLARVWDFLRFLVWSDVFKHTNILRLVQNPANQEWIVRLAQTMELLWDEPRDTRYSDPVKKVVVIHDGNQEVPLCQLTIAAATILPNEAAYELPFFRTQHLSQEQNADLVRHWVKSRIHDLYFGIRDTEKASQAAAKTLSSQDGDETEAQTFLNLHWGTGWKKYHYRRHLPDSITLRNGKKVYGFAPIQSRFPADPDRLLRVQNPDGSYDRESTLKAKNAVFAALGAPEEIGRFA